MLIGTTSVEKSEHLSKHLTKVNIKHCVLNAKCHSQESDIIAQAGRLNSVTIATNMAGRGTDIKLGGIKYKHQFKDFFPNEKEKVIDKGGLYIIGTERHESRRIDDQLRGRSGRQGDTGQTKFFLSLEDDLMRIFGSDRIAKFLDRLGLEDHESIEHPWINKSIIKAQQKVEKRNYEIRKTLLQFDNVINSQRELIYQQRIDIIREVNFLDIIQNKFVSYHENLNKEIKSKKVNLKLIILKINRIYDMQVSLLDLKNNTTEVIKKIDNISRIAINEKKSVLGLETFNKLIKSIFIFNIDQVWKEHLYTLDQIKQNINLRAYGQREPLNEYKLEAFQLFESMFQELEERIIMQIVKIQVK